MSVTATTDVDASLSKIPEDRREAYIKIAREEFVRHEVAERRWSPVDDHSSVDLQSASLQKVSEWAFADQGERRLELYEFGEKYLLVVNHQYEIDDVAPTQYVHSVHDTEEAALAATAKFNLVMHDFVPASVPGL